MLYNYSKDTKEMIEKYKYIGINKVEEISIDCSSCENYKEENVIDIFELLRRKEEEKNKKGNAGKE